MTNDFTLRVSMKECREEREQENHDQNDQERKICFIENELGGMVHLRTTQENGATSRVPASFTHHGERAVN